MHRSHAICLSRSCINTSSMTMPDEQLCLLHQALPLLCTACPAAYLHFFRHGFCNLVIDSGVRALQSGEHIFVFALNMTDRLRATSCSVIAWMLFNKTIAPRVRLGGGRVDSTPIKHWSISMALRDCTHIMPGCDRYHVKFQGYFVGLVTEGSGLLRNRSGRHRCYFLGLI